MSAKPKPCLTHDPVYDPLCRACRRASAEAGLPTVAPSSEEDAEPPLCNAGRYGKMCTLPAGHEGDHRAEAGHSDYVDHWPQTPAPAISEPPSSTRLVLNAYGRRCYEAGERKAAAQLAEARQDAHTWQEAYDRVNKERREIADRSVSLREALEKIAAHDGLRHDWSTDVAIPKPSPQELAQEALSAAVSTPATEVWVEFAADPEDPEPGVIYAHLRGVNQAHLTGHGKTREEAMALLGDAMHGLWCPEHGIDAPVPPAPQYGTDVLCESCAVVFCPHAERLHFDKDGCPQCDASGSSAPQPVDPGWAEVNACGCWDSACSAEHHAIKERLAAIQKEGAK